MDKNLQAERGEKLKAYQQGYENARKEFEKKQSETPEAHPVNGVPASFWERMQKSASSLAEEWNERRREKKKEKKKRYSYRWYLYVQDDVYRVQVYIEDGEPYQLDIHANSPPFATYRDAETWAMTMMESLN